MRVSVGNPGSIYAKVYLDGVKQDFVQLADEDGQYICQYIYTDPTSAFIRVSSRKGKDLPYKAVHKRGLVQIAFDCPEDPGLVKVLEDYYKSNPAINEDYITPYNDLICYGCNEIVDRTI